MLNYSRVKNGENTAAHRTRDTTARQGIHRRHTSDHRPCVPRPAGGDAVTFEVSLHGRRAPRWRPLTAADVAALRSGKESTMRYILELRYQSG